MQYAPVKGMNDILPDEIDRWYRLESAFRRVVSRYRYGEVRTPLLEHTELFVRSIGETTDVVEKEMFTFARPKGESLTMRPEGTAGAARAYLTNKVQSREPLTRWYYLGPMFRAEQPQRGRYRQFHQAGCEVYGDLGPLVDAEMLDMLVTFFHEVGVFDVEVCINSIGGEAARARYRSALTEFLRPRAQELSEHARSRLETNPLRVLDSKDARDRAAVTEAPSILEMLEGEDRQHWEGLLTALDALGTPYLVRPGLVRGLDYYSRTLFELNATSGELGAQNTLCGGGRYDGMVKSLGGPDTPAIGFAMGLERILLAAAAVPAAKTPFCVLAPLGRSAQLTALAVARDLRAAGIAVDLDGRGNSLKSMLRRADALRARLCLVIGDSEVARAVVQVKDLAGHSAAEVALGDLPGRIGELLATTPSPPEGA
ncbi:MAG: histidine--tRNA ligase [Polyangiaceae bacterium]|nr:histidine--tRNA ligase [Polyangiaceae bacterium]